MSSLSIRILFHYGLYPSPQFALLSFQILPSLIHQLTSYESFFLNILLLIIIASLCILMALNPNMALVLPFCSPLNTSSFNYQVCLVSLRLSFTLRLKKALFLPIFILCNLYILKILSPFYTPSLLFSL